MITVIAREQKLNLNLVTYIESSIMPGIPQNNLTGGRVLRNIQIVAFSLAICYFGKLLLVPLFFGLLIAITMYPVCKSLEQRRLSKSIAISVCLLIVAVLFAALILLLAWQIVVFREDLTELIARLRAMLPQLQNWLKENFSITIELQDRWLSDFAAGIPGRAGQLIGPTFNAVAGLLFSLLLIPIYTALFLYYRRNFVRALYQMVGPEQQSQLTVALNETVRTYFNYIKGMVLVYLIVGILNSIGLLALGIKHAILFGMLTAIMTIIPYFGIIVSASIPVAIAFLTKDSIWYPAGVVFVFVFVQYLEANIIFPKVVGSQLNVSTLAMLVAIIAGGLIWGTAGMVLFIPFVAILKIVSCHFKSLDAVRLLLERDPEAV